MRRPNGGVSTSYGTAAALRPGAAGKSRKRLPRLAAASARFERFERCISHWHQHQILTILDTAGMG